MSIAYRTRDGQLTFNLDEYRLAYVGIQSSACMVRTCYELD